MEMAPEGPKDVVLGGPSEVAHGGPGEVAHGGLGKEELNKARITRRTFISQMRRKVLSGPSNQPVGPDVPCRVPQTRNVAIRAILFRTRETRETALEEERQRWREDSV